MCHYQDLGRQSLVPTPGKPRDEPLGEVDAHRDVPAQGHKPGPSDAAHPLAAGARLHRDDASRTTRKRLQTAVDLFTYLALPMICVTAFWCSPAVQPLLVIVSLAQTLALAVLGWQFLRYAER